AQLHLLVQFPVLNISDTIRDEHLVMRQKEFIFCLQRNLLSPHVSLHCSEESKDCKFRTYRQCHKSQRLLKPVSSEVLNKIDYRGNLYGIEQVLMFYLRAYEGFKFKNPCKILQIVHRHCMKSAEKSHSGLFQGQTIDNYLKLSYRHKPRELILAPFSDL
ncbi:unnamed protein product, partial [Porites lobata]